MRHLAWLVAPAALILGLAGIVSPSRATDLAAHRAVYDLKLDTTRGSDVAAASGTMAYEVQDVCDGWAVRQRLQMAVTNRDGQDIQMISDYTTWESKDALKLRFRMRQTTDQAVTSDVSGDASLAPNGGPGTAHYTTPEETTKELPKGTLFPMAHTAAILAVAEAGKKVIGVPLFDGTTASGAQDSSIVITSWNPPHEEKWPDLAKLPSGRMHIAFFDRDAASQQPDYEVSMRYWANGVADDLQMDFGDFVMAGKMTDFKLLPHGC